MLPTHQVQRQSIAPRRTLIRQNIERDGASERSITPVFRTPARAVVAPTLLLTLFLAGADPAVAGSSATVATSVAKTVTVPVATTVLTLNQAIQQAIDNDAWLEGSQFEQQAASAMAESAYQLPDPKFSLKMANLPTDTLDFNQEAMTQIVAGVSQMYPRGDSRRLKRLQLQQQSARQPLLRAERQAQLKLTVTQLWLDAYQARQSVKLIEQDRALFDQLEDISLASYSSALDRTRQQDLIKAQLENTRIEDRLTRLLQKQDMAEQKLLEWLLPSAGNFASGTNQYSDYAADLPQLQSLYAELWQGELISDSELASYLVRHPSVQKLDQNIAVATTAVQLAEQKYKPEWGVNASYGYRGDDMNGRDRADLVSAGVTVSLPLFSSTRQDKEVEAANASKEKIRTDRSLMIRQMMASFKSAHSQLQRLEQRQQLFDRKLTPQIQQQAQAALNAYESDNGSFTEVVRARIAELNTRIESLEISVARQKQIAQLNYFLTATDPVAINSPRRTTGVTQ